MLFSVYIFTRTSCNQVRGDLQNFRMFFPSSKFHQLHVHCIRNHMKTNNHFIIVVVGVQIHK